MKTFVRFAFYLAEGVFNKVSNFCRMKRDFFKYCLLDSATLNNGTFLKVVITQLLFINNILRLYIVQTGSFKGFHQTAFSKEAFSLD